MSTESRSISDAIRQKSIDENSMNGTTVELDARTLVKDCLKEVGRELGVGR